MARPLRIELAGGLYRVTSRGDGFIAKMQKSAMDISEVPRVQRRAKAKLLSYYIEFENKKEGMVAAYQTGDYSMEAIADFSGSLRNGESSG